MNKLNTIYGLCRLPAKYIAKSNFSTEASYSIIKCNESNGVATLNLQFKPANIFTWDYMSHLQEQIKHIEKQQFRALIVTSSLKTFIGGGDINEFYSKKRVYDYIKKIEELSLALYALPMPTIAAINGHGFGGGCVFANACDYRFILKSAKFGINELALGLLVPYFVTHRTSEILGHQMGYRVCLEGKLMTAEEVFAIKWVDGIAEDADQLMKMSTDKAEELIKIPIASYASLKKTSQLEFFERNEKYGHQSRVAFVDCASSDSTNAILANVLKSLGKK